MGDAADRFQPPVRPAVCGHLTMLFTADRASCCLCGQRWDMDYDQAGRPRGWVPTGRH